MANIFAVSPILRLHRSAQSADYTMTLLWQTIYQQSRVYAWMFGSARINLSNMVAADLIDVRVSTRNVASGDWVVEDQFDYADAQPTNKQKIVIGSILSTFGVRIEMRQTVGALINCYCEFNDAVR